MYGIHLCNNIINPEDKVLDIGGFAQPFRRANAGLDVFPYKDRQTTNTFLLGMPEKFTSDTWFQQDICNHSRPFPFFDNEFDFAVCGHVLEDVRDPLYVIEEMQRVAKRGYIEVPSRFYEQLLGIEHPKMVGATHHRWIICLEYDDNLGESILGFRFKPHNLHFLNRYHLAPPSGNQYPFLNPNREVLGLLWEGSFAAMEDLDHAIKGGDRFLSETVEQASRLGPDLWDQAKGFPCEFDSFPFQTGIISLSQVDHLIARRISLYNITTRAVSRSVLEYEKRIIPDYPRSGTVLEELYFDRLETSLDMSRKLKLKKFIMKSVTKCFSRDNE